MNLPLPFFIAVRYLFSYKRRHVINVISLVVTAGVGVATMALVCTLSVFNGFQDLVASLFTSFDPELKVVPAAGKTATADDPALAAVRTHKDVAAASECLEGMALIRYGNAQTVATVKGVDSSYVHTSGISDILYGDGSFVTKADMLDYGMPGLQLAAQLGLGIRYERPLEVYAPRKGERVSLANPAQGFSRGELRSPGVVFSVNQKKYDTEYILTSIDFTRRLFGHQGMLSSLELKLKEGTDTDAVQRELQRIAGAKFKVLNRYEQQGDMFRIMHMEKLVAGIFLTFILVVACLNITGTLSMLIIEKRDDADTLRSLGAEDIMIGRIFLYVGQLVSFLGAVAGIVAGLLLCMAQQRYGMLKMGDDAGSFIVDTYPVRVQASDIALVAVTVMAAGSIAAWYSVRHMGRHPL